MVNTPRLVEVSHDDDPPTNKMTTLATGKLMLLLTDKLLIEFVYFSCVDS